MLKKTSIPTEVWVGLWKIWLYFTQPRFMEWQANALPCQMDRWQHQGYDINVQCLWYQCAVSMTVFPEVTLSNFRLLNRLLIWLDHQRHKYTYTWNFLRTFHTNEYKFLRKPCVNLSNHVLESGPILLAFVRRKFGRILDISVRFLCTNIMFTCEFYNILTTDSFVSYRIRRGSGTCKYL